MIAEMDSVAGSKQPSPKPAQPEIQRLNILLCMIQVNIELYKEMSKRLGAEACLPIIEEIEQIVKGGMTAKSEKG